MRLIGIVCLVFVLSLSGCAKKKAPLTPEIPSYQKPSDATIRLEGDRFPYCIWYDPNQWVILDTPFDSCDDSSEWTLVLVDLDEQVSLGKNLVKKAFAKIYTYDEKSVSRAAYKDFVQSKILSQDRGKLLAFKDLNSEERIVNNIKVFAWRFMVEYEEVGSITTMLYFYSDGEGSVAVTTFTPSDKWKENEAAMESFLNGFCLLQPS